MRKSLHVWWLWSYLTPKVCMVQITCIMFYPYCSFLLLLFDLQPVSQVKPCNMFLSLDTARGVCSCLFCQISVYPTQEMALICRHQRLLIKLLSAISRSSACRYAGDVEINVEIKKYFCKAGVKGVQVRKQITRHASRTIPSSFQLSVFRSCTGSCAWSWSLWSETYRWWGPSRCSSSAGLWVLQLPTPVFLSAVHVFCVFTIICFLETGHQLDWTDQPVRYSWTQVS